MSVKKLRAELRMAIADYMLSEGCDCCQGNSHNDDAEKIAKLLNVPKYADGYGYDFFKYGGQDK